MNADWYAEWVDMHCQATGADARAKAALLSPVVRYALVEHGGATPAEMGEVTTRLVANLSVPRFASEHSDAVGRELVRLREERSARNRSAPPGDFAPACGACGGSGLAVIPVRACVWERRLVLHPELKRLVTGAVLCDRPGCEAGRVAVEKERARKGDGPRRPALSAVERAVGCDLVKLLADYERERAAVARKQVAGPVEAALAKLLADIRERNREHKEAA